MSASEPRLLDLVRNRIRFPVRDRYAENGHCYYVYVLMSVRDGNWYTGFTGDLRARMQQHRAGSSKSTKHRGPWKLIYYEASLSIEDAQARERYLKSGMGKRYLRNRMKTFLSNLGADL
jgi:putative endonuclease